MTPEYWEKATTIFHHACELNGAEQEHYIKKACDGNKHLHELVKRLLKSDSDPANFLNQPVGMSLADEKDRSGEKVGDYELLRSIGKGGMGTVYLATPTNKPFTRHVAIKVMNSRIHSEPIAARFLQEMRIMATFEHEAIARLYDGGITENGEHFFVMEYVDGKPVDQYCNEKGLSTKERLILFQKVCFAVQEAHKTPVVHRDIKPSNILVTKNGQPKLLDFGIARILSNEYDSASFNQNSLRLSVLTPRYASPEQLGLNGEPVTTVSDIFSLGVVLYELLTSRHPFLKGENSVESVKKIIDDKEPAKPSAVGKGRKIGGDLDRIILTAMHKNPKKRYDSAQEFADDLENYLEHRPIKATKSTIWYRSRKYIRRHTIAAIALVTILTLSVAFGINANIQVNKLAVEQNNIKQVNNFLVDLFTATDPNTAKGDTLTAFDLLQRGTEKISTELEDQPLVQAKLMHVIGSAYHNLGDYVKAEMMLRKALLSREKAGENTSRELVFTLLDLARTLQETSDLKEAKLVATEALYKCKDAFGLQDTLTAICLTRIGSVQSVAGKHESALPYFNEALQIRRKILPEIHPDIADNLNELGVLSKRLGEYEAAESFYLSALDMKMGLHGREHSSTAITTNNLAILYEKQGKFVLADSLHRKVLRIWTKHYGKEHPHVLYSLNNLGVLLTKRGRFDEAEEFLTRSLLLRRKVLGEHHRHVASTANNLAVNYKKIGSYTRADSLYKEAISIITTTLGAEHSLVPLYQVNQANTLHLMGDVAEAEALLKSALKTNRKIYGETHWQIARTLQNFGTNEFKKQNYADAERYYKEALKMYTETLGQQHYRVANVHFNLANLYHETGKFGEAGSEFSKSLDLRRKVLAKGHPDFIQSLEKYGEFLVQQKEFTTAEKLLKEALEHSRMRFEGDDWHISQSQNALASCFMAERKFSQAESILLSSYSNLRIKNETHPETKKTLDLLNELYTLWERPEKIAHFQN